MCTELIRVRQITIRDDIAISIVCRPGVTNYTNDNNTSTTSSSLSAVAVAVAVAVASPLIWHKYST